MPPNKSLYKYFTLKSEKMQYRIKNFSVKGVDYNYKITTSYNKTKKTAKRRSL